MVTPLSRTRRTAEAIFAAGYPAHRACASSPDLIEQNLGEWQGLPHAELPARLTPAGAPVLAARRHERPPGGESMAEVHRPRRRRPWSGWRDAHAGEDVVVVSHGGAIRAAVAHCAAASAPTTRCTCPCRTCR